MAHLIADMLPEMRVELPGIPEPILVDALDFTVSDFLSKSELWKYTSPILLDWTTALVFPAMVVGTDIPANTRIVRIDTVKYASGGVNLRKLTFKTRDQLDEIYSDWEVKTGNAALYWTNDGPETPRIIPIATANVNGSIQVRSVIASIEALLAIPDFVMHEYEEDIRVGTLSRLMKMPGKDWTNFAAARAYALSYKAGWMRAKVRAQADSGQPFREASYGGIGGPDTRGKRRNDYGRPW